MLKTAVLGARSAILWVVSIGHFLVVCTALVILGMFKDPRHNDRPQRWFFRNVVRLAGARLRIRYAPGFDPSRPALFICNHVNIFDPMVIYSAIPQFVRGLELESHFRIPAYGWMVGRFGNIPLPAQHGRAELQEVWRRIKAALDSGTSIIVFAEGHRTRTGHVAPFKKGIFRMAPEFGYPIAPMTITGSYEFNRRDSWMLKPATIEVFLHEMIEVAELGRQGVDALIERVHAVVSLPVEAHMGYVPGEELTSYRLANSREQIIANQRPGVSSAPYAGQRAPDVQRTGD